MKEVIKQVEAGFKGQFHIEGLADTIWSIKHRGVYLIETKDHDTNESSRFVEVFCIQEYDIFITYLN